MSSRDSGDEDDDARTGIPMTPEEVKAVQLSILDRFSARCAAVGIQFFAYYGTLLGAMRHQGYIPWDDDIDLALERHQYERVAQLDWATSGLDLLVPGTQGYPLPFMKLSDPRTRLREDVREPWQDWGGVNIDLWPLDYAPATRIGSTTRELAIRTRTTIQLAHTLRDDPARPVLRRAAHNTNKLLMGRAPLQRLNVWLDRRIARTPPSKELEACYGANWNRRRIPVDAIHPPLMAPFEGRQIPVPGDADAVLTALYGDWRTPPPEPTPASHHAYQATWINADLNREKTAHATPGPSRAPSPRVGARPQVLVTSGFYSPAYLGGGPIQTLHALVTSTAADFDIKLICANHDLGQTAPLVDTPNSWLSVDGAKVRYVGSGFANLLAAYRAADDVEVVYLNSLFNPRYSVLPLALRRIGCWRRATVVLAPRGELSPGALQLKAPKKRAFLRAFRALGLHKLVHWHASTQDEAAHIRAAFGHRARVLVREDETSLPANPAKRGTRQRAAELRLLFASRLDAKKGLTTLFEALSEVAGSVRVDVVGAFQDPTYKSSCHALLSALPNNVTLTFHGALPREEVLHHMRRADALALPTAGENFGHVIPEALSQSCPVICSTHTPWTSRLESGGGIIVSPNTAAAWAAAIDGYASRGPTGWEQASRDAALAYLLWRTEPKGPSIFELSIATKR